MLKALGLDQEEGQVYSFIWSCIQIQPTSWLELILHTFSVGTSHRRPWTHLTHHGPNSGGSHHLPPYSILCNSPPQLHPDGSFSRDFQSEVPKLSRFGLPGFWAFITFRPELKSGRGLNQSCSSPRELSNGVLHFTCTHRNQVDSRLFSGRESNCQFDSRPFFRPLLVLQMSKWLM